MTLRNDRTSRPGCGTPIDLHLLQLHNESTITIGDSADIVTPDACWAYAASIPSHALPSSPSLILVTIKNSCSERRSWVLLVAA